MLASFKNIMDVVFAHVDSSEVPFTLIFITVGRINNLDVNNTETGSTDKLP